MTVIDIVVATRDNAEELTQTVRSISRLDGRFRYSAIFVESWGDAGEASSIIGLLRGCNKMSIRVIRQWPPRGVYSALNKGLEHSTGELVIFMNSGDSFFASDSLDNLAGHYFSLCKEDRMYTPKCVFGRTRVDAYAGKLKWYVPFGVRTNEVSAWIRHAWPCHQACLFSGDWARRNYYNENGSIWADAEIVRRAIEKPDKEYYEGVVAVFKMNGISSRPPSLRETKEILRTPYEKNKVRILIRFAATPMWRFYPAALLTKAFIHAMHSRVMVTLDRLLKEGYRLR